MIQKNPIAQKSIHRISRRQMLKTTLGTTLGLSILNCAGRPDPSAIPNIVMIVPDALRAKSLPMYGCPRDTAPFLQSFSTKSTLFKRCYSSALWTRPSVTGLLTGLASGEHRHSRFEESVASDMPTFSRILGEAGYQTGFFTSNLAIGEGFGMEKHFDQVIYKAGEKRDFAGPRIIHECEEWLDELSKEPVCLYLHLLPPHGPYNPPAEFIDRFMGMDRPKADYLKPEHREVDASLGGKCLGRVPWYEAENCFSRDPLHHLTLYEANIAYADSMIADFMHRWNRLRGHQRTIFIVTSDHGEAMGEHGHFFGHGKLLIDEIMHVPLIIQDSAAPKGCEVECAVSHLDLANSILAWAGSDRRIGTFGNALILSPDEGENHSRPVITQNYLDGGEPGTAITKDEWRLVYNDCAKCGNSHFIRIDSCNSDASKVKRISLPIPETAIPHSIEAAPSVTIESFAIDAIYVEADQEYHFSGSIKLDEKVEGNLSIRARMPGSDPVFLGEFPCNGPRTEIEGVFPAFKPNHATAPTHIICEARWAPPSETPTASWRRLQSFPLFTPVVVIDEMQLTGLTLEPPVACPGDLIQVNYIWQFLKKPLVRHGVLVEFRNKRDEVVFRNDHLLLADPGDPESEPLPLEKYNKDLRFNETVRVRIPETTEAEEYAIWLGFYTYEIDSERKVFNKRPVGSLKPVGTFNVVETPFEAFHQLVNREERRSNFQVFASDKINTPEGYQQIEADLKAFANMYPHEGHSKYLMAINAKEPERQKVLLDQCLSKTPYHFAALSMARQHGLKNELTDYELNKLIPSRSCNFDFMKMLRLYGFNMTRTPSKDGIYIWLNWTALAPIRKILGAELIFDIILHNGKKRQKSYDWVIGGGNRPTSEWNIGEAVREVVFKPMIKRIKSISIKLRVFPYWDYVYSNRTNKNYLPVNTEDNDQGLNACLETIEFKSIRRKKNDLLDKKRADNKFYRLYNLADDPFEKSNVINKAPEITEAMRIDLWKMIDCFNVFNPENSTNINQQGLSEETLESLRALGYIK